MKIDVIGSGSAFSKRCNTSAIKITDSLENQWLIDCGPTIPRAIWQRNIGVNDIAVIYFTHIHPDHSSGLAALINQWKSFKRTEPLTIFCQSDQRQPLQALVDLAVWPETQLCFDIHWQDIADDFEWKHWQIRTANTQHEMANKALRITIEGKSVFYSGDGRPTKASEALMEGVDIAFQECASFHALDGGSSHGDFPDCQRLLAETNVRALGIYHCFDEAIPSLLAATSGHPALFLSRDGLQFDLNNFDLSSHPMNQGEVL
ncbi:MULTISPECIES: MBL fold metallo-hydrolase [Marinomonas]|uniref:Ribonuclease BN (tRNA processing enzyme) n=1 Tax=Marinomonas alcarazii TaxID=491949 RepID=A0A318UW03_9GAMM|nr:MULTISPECIES: ribonuclease Z [Marinomonas]PYF80564.1 ribonuclease BN (tRNA processing enzyme) [Marinomonas alcarazii]